MDRQKKIRGQRRRKINIEKWRIESLPLDIEKVKESHYDYTKIWVSPWDNLRYRKRDYTGPKSENRTLILNALLDIYESWDMQLKKLGIPYYLKIWLYEPRFTSSQIVCAINDRIKYYENIFTENNTKLVFPVDRYKSQTERLNNFNWNLAVDEEIIENDFWPKEQYEYEKEFFQDQRLFKRLDNRKVKKEDLIENDKRIIRYFVPKGNIWIGTTK